jgi:hypothetical protein
MNKIGKYPVLRYLGALKVEGEIYRYGGRSGGPGGEQEIRPTKVLDLGINNVTSLRELLKVDKKFPVSSEIKVALNKGYDFYRVTLVANFAPERGPKFIEGTISVKAYGRHRKSDAFVYSIFPLRIEEKKRITKKIGIEPSAKLFDIELNPGISYVDERVYDKVHPIVIGKFASKQYASWDFKTDYITPHGVEGTQIVEFMVKQPVGKSSTWIAAPTGILEPEGGYFTRRILSFIGRKRSSKPRASTSKGEKFTVPLDD